MDLGAVKAASRPELLACVAAAAENAREEFGKASSLVVLATMPKNVRAQAPVRRMLEWHQLKLVGGMLMAVVKFGPPGAAARLAAMPVRQLEQVLEETDAFAEDADRLKLRGLYIDMDRNGRIQRPSEITETDVSGQLARARQVASSASVFCDPGVLLADPPAEAIELSRALVHAFAEAGDVRSPGAAADIVLRAVSDLQQQLAASHKKARSLS